MRIVFNKRIKLNNGMSFLVFSKRKRTPTIVSVLSVPATTYFPGRLPERLISTAKLNYRGGITV